MIYFQIGLPVPGFVPRVGIVPGISHGCGCQMRNGRMSAVPILTFTLSRRLECLVAQIYLPYSGHLLVAESKRVLMGHE